jgi:hypothetical protein
MFKIAVVKIGARITVSNTGTAASTGETLVIIDMLVKSGVSVDAYTKVLNKDIKPNTFTIYNIEDEYKNINNRKYDALLIINGNGNFFGGAEDINILLTYNIINNFKGKVFYLVSDLACCLKQIWPNVSNKEWGSKYKEEDISITREDINIIAQCNNLKGFRDITDKDKIKFDKIYHFPIEKYSLYSDKLYNNSYKDIDILYGGAFRQGRREKDMIKYYFGYPDDIDIRMFGKVKISDFKTKHYSNLRPPVFEAPVKYTDFLLKMSTSKSTIIIGDLLYKKLEMLTLRIYESIQAGVITFIDSDFDKNHLVYNNKVLQDICYVNSREDIIDRIKYIKSNSAIMRDIIKMQREDTLLNKNDYANAFRDIIVNNI